MSSYSKAVPTEGTNKGGSENPGSSGQKGKPSMQGMSKDDGIVSPGFEKGHGKNAFSKQGKSKGDGKFSPGFEKGHGKNAFSKGSDKGSGKDVFAKGYGKDENDFRAQAREFKCPWIARIRLTHGDGSSEKIPVCLLCRGRDPRFTRIDEEYIEDHGCVPTDSIVITLLWSLN